MKSVIVYTSKTGTTKKCVDMLLERLDDAVSVDLEKESVDISTYDMIIIGSPIRIGMMNKNVKKFIDENIEILKNKKYAFFICCGFVDSYKKYYEENIPSELLEGAIFYDTFGGEMALDKQKGFDKMVVKMVSKKIKNVSDIKILEDRVENFSDVVSEWKE